MFTLICFLFSVLSLAFMNDAFDVGFTSEMPHVNTYDKMPPRSGPLETQLRWGMFRCVFDNSGTLHLKKPNDYSELATNKP
ncbi:hypothetical protein, conserved [Eimeria necatrix]|uniref:Uncharacterized protein n=1 Tax=Eimeria necatrix TaxID=51315 RepID=U6MVH1_9EIME|nr:hypothetical protein, conserved [Eimeria necatrix]CDJ65685.1 hypothetical protein, conserved [Eimeria necatrix]